MKNIYSQKAGAFFFFCSLFLFSFNGFAQVGIGTTDPNANALLDIDASTTPGGLLLPRVALVATNSISPLPGPLPVDLRGITVYNTATAGTGVNRVTPGFYYHDGATWVRISGGSAPNTGWDILGNAGTTAGTNFLGTTDNNALRFKTVNLDRFEITSGNAAAAGRLRAFTDGTAASPTYSWNTTNNNSTGIFLPALRTLGFSTFGTERMRILADGRVTVNNAGAYTFMLNSTAAGTNGAVIGASQNGTGVQGQTTGSGNGVVGVATGSGNGVVGQAVSAGAQGGDFYNGQTNGFGLWALGGGNTYRGFMNSGTGAMITGRAFGTTSFASGVNGEGIAGIGDNISALPIRPLGTGVVGYGYQAGVFGDSGYYGQNGVHGSAEGNPALTNSGTGVYGENVGNLGFGVAGESTNIGVYGNGAHGAIFESSNGGGFGAWVENIATSGDRIGLAVAGQNLGVSSLGGAGAVFVGNLSAGAGFAENTNGTGLIGAGNNITTANLAQNGSGLAGTGTTVGVYGKANASTNGIGVIGAGNNLGTYNVPAGDLGAGVAGTGVNIGVFGHATDAAGFGVYSSGKLFASGDISTTGDIAGNGFSFTGGDLAINGDEAIGGNLTVAGNSTVTGTKSFMIDDPRDPANKYLKHFSIESNEILNIYRGVIIFDASGEAVVRLPDYYGYINKNASYQLTPIGAAMPNLYIATEVNNGTFVIAGGVPGKKVSWTLTAERNDPYIRNNPEVRNVVVDKGADRGRYLAPGVYGQSADQGIVNNRISKIQTSSNSTVAKQAIGSQEIQSKIVEAKKVDKKQVQSLTTPLKSSRTQSSGEKVLRDVPLEKAQKTDVTAKMAELEGQSTSAGSVSSETNNQTSGSEQAPSKSLQTPDNN